MCAGALQCLAALPAPGYCPAPLAPMASDWRPSGGACRASPYLLHLCGYLALNYIISSSFYFEKTLVVARGEHLIARRCRAPALDHICSPVAHDLSGSAQDQHAALSMPSHLPDLLLSSFMQCGTPPAGLLGLPPSTVRPRCASSDFSCWQQVSCLEQKLVRRFCGPE